MLITFANKADPVKRAKIQQVDNIKALNFSLQTKLASNLGSNEQMFTHADPINYIAIELSERLGVDKPTERQIEVLESLLSKTIIYKTIIFDERLNNKETLCLVFAAQGKSSKETALLLGLSQTQVEFYRKEIRRKLSCASMAQAVYEGIRYGCLRERTVTENNNPPIRIQKNIAAVNK